MCFSLVVLVFLKNLIFEMYELNRFVSLSVVRILYQATDGGTIALDWLMHSDG